MAQIGQQQRKDLELVFSLQSHYKHFFKNYGDIVGVYDIPSITMQWESFKSYLLKNSGIMFDNITPPSSSPSSNSPQPNSLQLMEDIQIRYVNTTGLELPINNQEDFQYALYSFRERARIGEINHLKLTRVKGNGAASINTGSVATCDSNVVVEVDNSGVRAENAVRMRNCSGGDGLELGQVVDGKDEEKTPEWFSKYMKKFKQEIIQEITKVNTTQMSSNLKKIQAANHVACPKRRQNKSEHYKRRPKMTYTNNIATENTSCDNTDVNTIATTPIMTNPQTSTLIPPKLLNAQTRKHESTPQTKPDNINKQIKLKAKRLATSNNTNARGSSDSDTLTVIKQATVKTDPKCLAHAREVREHEFRLKYRENAAFKKRAADNKPFDQSRMSSEIVESDDPVVTAYCVELPTSLIYENCIKSKRMIEFPISTQQHNIKNASSRYINTEHNYSSAMAPNHKKSAGAMNPSDLPWELSTKNAKTGLDVVRKYRAEVVEEDQCWRVGKAEQVDSYMKKWRIRNTGERNFDSMTTLRFTWGSLYPIIPWAECPFLQPGESGWLSVCVKIPEHIGSYECHCRLYQGSERFGPWLGFRLNVMAPDSIGDQSDIVSRVRITSLFPPQQYSPILMNNNHKVELNCDNSDKGTVDVDVDDVVAVIQGMVVRDDDLDKSDDLGQSKLPNIPKLAKVVGPVFKENGQISTDDQDEFFINAPDHNMRYTIEKQQVNKQLQMHTDSDNEEDSDEDDINVGKDLVMVDKHLQDNSDSDNVSIVSIAESNQSNHSVAATNISIAGSFSSGNGSASEEFVVIPMPKRNSLTLSDGDDNSCPELEPDPECCEREGNNRKVEENMEKRTVLNENVTRGKKNENVGDFVEIERSAPQPQTNPMKSQSGESSEQNFTYAAMATAVAIALKHQQQKKQEKDRMQQQQSLFDKLQRGISDDNRWLLSKNCDNAIAAEEDVKIGFEAGYCRTDEVVIDIDDFGFVGGFDRTPTTTTTTTTEEQQTCPVDLSTNNSSKGSFVSYNSTDPGRKKSQIFGENKQHCAATLCDLCINTIMKNKLENAKKRLFVFPEDSPGFEVFAPVNNCLNLKEHQTPVQKLTPNTEEHNIKINPFNPFARLQNLEEADVIIQNNNDFPAGIWTVQENVSSNYMFVNTQDTPAFESPSSYSTPKNQSSNLTTFAQPYNLTATKLCSDTVNVTSTINEGNVKSTTDSKDQPITDKVLANSNDSDSNSSSDSVFLCPSCHCDGECSKFQSESDYRNSLKSKNDNKILTADEIRAQMRQLFVQLADLEPQKDRYLTNEKSSQNIPIDSAKVHNNEENENLVDVVFAEEQPSKSTNVERIQSAMSNSSLESFGNYLDTPHSEEIKDGKQISKFAMYRKNIPSSSVTVEASQDELSSTRLTKLNDMCRESFPFVEYSTKEKRTSKFAIATNILNEEAPIRDICLTSLDHVGCSNKPHEFQNHNEESQIGNVPPSSNGKLIDAPTPDGSFIEGASAPVENDNHMTAKTAEEEYISQAVEQHRLIQLHCKHDTALAENMNVLYEMGFRNFYGNMQLLKSHENNIILVLELLLPRF